VVKGAKFGIFLTRMETTSKTMVARRIQCNRFNVSYHSKTDEKEMELYIPQDEQAQLIDIWI